ncbi:MAG TPA: stage II sporulation protein M [Gemmatimonadaceae bacterium]|nr:stage II sporulation protein M [Gemmatimonadaceae bacterium]
MPALLHGGVVVHPVVMQERLTQTVDIETPELVVLSYTIAGLGSRLGAALIDLAVSALLFITVILAAARVSPKSLAKVDVRAAPTTAWAVALLVILQFAVLWGYYLLFEGLRDGQTPGKRVFRLRAVRDGGYSVGFAASAVRNLMRIVDLQPVFTYLVGIASVAFSKSGKRLGDMVAGTIVVRESLVRQPAVPKAARRAIPGATPAPTPSPAIAQLTDVEFQLLERWAARRGDLSPERRRQLTTQVASRVHHALPRGDESSESARLMRLYTEEREAREHGAAAHGATGASRERYAIVTTRSPRWIAFSSRLADAQRRGLKALGEKGVREFVEEYRALTNDLAKLRTAARGETSDELFYLGRLVAGAHNLLYRDRRNTFLEILRFVAFDVPTEVRRSVRPIALAAAFLFVPAAISYTAVVRHPDVAPTFIPPQMLDRAEEGVTRARQGTGYIPDPQVFRPVMASRIIANNVQVTFAAFAFGITAGIGTLVLLLLNGISLGGVFGLYASKGILALLVAFVAPHGVLELSAICISAGGGLLVAAALLIPGDRTRRRALVENSQRAMRLIAASTLLLIVAGSLEGMVSPIPNWPLWLKLAVSATTVLLLVAYLQGGVSRKASAGEGGEDHNEVLGLSVGQ